MAFYDAKRISRREFLCLAMQLASVAGISLLSSERLLSGHASAQLKSPQEKNCCFADIKSIVNPVYQDQAEPPGSLFKLLTTMVLLEENLINPNEQFECRGHTIVANNIDYDIPCSHAHGSVNLHDAIAISCNAYFAHAIKPMKPAQFVAMWQRCFAQRQLKLGPDSRTLILYVLGLSEHTAVNSQDILLWMRDIATRGQSNVHLQDIKPSTWDVLHDAMRSAGRWGTGKLADPSDRFKLALKTGTSRNSHHQFRSWAAGFYPAENPKTIFCVRANGTSESGALPKLQALLKTMPV